MEYLDRFIQGEIAFSDIDDNIRICELFSLERAIRGALEDVSLLIYIVEDDLFEKLCYANVLWWHQNFDHEVLYAIYLFAKGKCPLHKLDWDALLEKLKKEFWINGRDIVEGTNMYKECQKKGGNYSDLLPSDYYDDNDDYDDE